MSAQEIRDSLAKGDIVTVVSGSGSVTRRRQAKILDVMRMAVRIVYSDSGKESTVRFSDLELPERAAPPEPVVSKKPQPRPLTPVTEAVPEPVTEPQDTSTLRRDLEAWRAMGRELELGLRALNAEILRETKALNEEKAAIEARLETLRKELESNNADLERLKIR